MKMQHGPSGDEGDRNKGSRQGELGVNEAGVRLATVNTAQSRLACDADGEETISAKSFTSRGCPSPIASPAIGVPRIPTAAKS
jgi:hypothetical protein